MKHGQLIHGLVTAALAVGLLVTNYRLDSVPTRTVVTTGAPLANTPKPSRTAWDTLGQDRTIAIGEALTASGAPAGPVMIYCSTLDCDALMHDLDDAFQIAGWPSDFERQAVDSEGDTGLFVGPQGNATAAAIGRALNAGGLHPKWADMPSVGVIIGRKPK